MKNKIKFLATMLMGVMLSVSQVWAVDDVLTRETTGITSGSTTYSSWENKTVTSDAVYAGHSAGGNDAIQLRTNNSNSGIVTTASGGKVTKVVVSWESHTANGRSIDIYGKNSAYTQATDLYSNDASTKGTKLGSISNGNTTLNIDGDYTYIGIRSNDGALYLNSVTITWGAACTENLAMPVVTATAGNGSATLTWGAVANATSYTVTCVGATIGSITGEGTKTCTLTGLNNGTQYTWKVKAIGGDIYCDSEEATGNVTPSANHTVAWYVDGEVYTEGSPTTEVADGGKVTTLPTQPKVPDACTGSAFVGWTDHEVTNGNKPSPLFKDAASAPKVNANVSYHAVFADPE